MKFTKVQGNGNDFILIDLLESKTSFLPSPAWLVHLCDRHYGIGADGVLVIESSPDQIPTMTIWNRDGSRPEMCGNGLRCVALYLYRRHIITHVHNVILTDAGPYMLFFPSESNLPQPDVVRVAMGTPTHLHQSSLPHTTSTKKRESLHCLSWGNPHGVTFNEEHFQNRESYSRLWPSHFEKGINLSFAHLINPTLIELHVFERGCGWTLACGTGACATAYMAVKLGLSPENIPLIIELPGGPLEIQVTQDQVCMTGGGEEVYYGEIHADQNP